MAKRHEDIAAERQREAKAALNRLDQQTETLGSSAFARMADKAAGHFSAQDRDKDDKIELWGTRIGRIAGLIFAIGLVIYLIRTYVM